MESLSSEVQELITKVAKGNGIEDYTVNVNKSVSKEGDGYVGILEAVNIIDKDSDKKLPLVAKKAPASENLRQQFPTRAAFLREITMYDEVFPEFKSFQEEHNIPHPFNSVTKMHGFIRDEFKEVLLLNNLNEEGFRLCDRTKPLDQQHLSLVLTTYAKLHAISHAMRRLEPERFERVTGNAKQHVMVEFQKNLPVANMWDNLDDPQAKASREAFYAPVIEAVKDEPRLVDAIKNFLSTMNYDFLQKEDDSGVMCHMDCWSANMMFKYEDKSNPNIPTKVTLIDWQMACITNPIHDISYFFYISAGKSDLRNYMRYLHVYHTALCENLTAFGLDPTSVYPFDLLNEQWKTHSKIGFFMCFVMLQQSLSETKTHDFEKMAEKGENIHDVSLRKIVVSDRFKERMRDLVEFMVDNRFI